MNRDLAFGCAGFVAAVGYYVLAGAIPPSDLADTVGPQGLPHIYAYVLGALSMVLAVRSLVGFCAGPPEGGHYEKFEQSVRLEPDTPSLHLGLRAAGIVLIGCAYIAIVPFAGYFLSLTALITVTTWYLGGGLNRRTIFVAVSGALVFWLLFVVLLGVDHPAGIWMNLF